MALFGVLRAGLSVVNTNPLYTPRELRHQLADSGARFIVILENFAHVLAEVIADTDIEHIVITGLGDLAHFSKRVAVNFVVRHVRRMVPSYTLPGAVPFRAAPLARGADSGPAQASVGADDIAFLQYTGGTTGVAKGAMLTHRNLVANLLQLAEFWKPLLSPGRDVMITPLPLYHVFCLTCDCLLFMQQGSLNVLITNPRDIPAFVNELRRWRMPLFTGVDTLYNALMDHPGFASIDFSALKLGVAGGMAIQARTAERWHALTGKLLAEGYGLTEASPVISCNPHDAPGEPGELCVRGPQVMRGYWHQDAETAGVLSADGWLRTGDIAVMEADGYLRIVDRKKDMIIVSGFKVFPSEIESVGVEHKRPKLVEIRESLPKSNIGKVLRRELMREEAMRSAVNG